MMVARIPMADFLALINNIIPSPSIVGRGPGGGREEEEEKKEEEVSIERDRGGKEEEGGLHFAALARAQIPELTGYGNEIAAREFAINLPPAAAAARMPEHA